MRDLISGEVLFVFGNFEKDIVELEMGIVNDFGVDILDKFNVKVCEICVELE